MKSYKKNINYLFLFLILSCSPSIDASQWTNSHVSRAKRSAEKVIEFSNENKLKQLGDRGDFTGALKIYKEIDVLAENASKEFELAANDADSEGVKYKDATPYSEELRRLASVHKKISFGMKSLISKYEKSLTQHTSYWNRDATTPRTLDELLK